MISHHPADDLLLAHASGSLDVARRIVVATHLESCPACRARVQALAVIGGVMMEAIEPVAMADDAWARMERRTGGSRGMPDDRPDGRDSAPLLERPALPVAMAWPRALDGCRVSPWRWLGPDMRWSRVTVPGDKAARLFLLRIGAGRALPVHTHSDNELTQVLHGSFHDGRALYGPGDFDEADGSIQHQPVVDRHGECICLAAVSGRLLFKGAVARVMSSLVGF